MLEGVHPSALKLFKESGYTDMEAIKSSLSEDELCEKVKDIHLLGIRSKTQLTKKILNSASRLIGVGAYCIGTNQIDMNAAIENGIAVFNSPFSNTRSVAEIVIAQCINLMRRVYEKSEAAHKGVWLKDSADSYEVRGKTLGIVGYGHIGSQVSVLAENMGMKVIFYDIEPKLSLGNANAVRSLNELLENADIVTLHIPGLPTTKNLIDASRLMIMKKGSVLINCSRGDVVDINAACEALISKQLHGFATDVFPVEPQNNTEKFVSPLQGIPTAVLTPHIGGSTQEAQENIGIEVAEKLVKYSDNGTSTSSVNFPEVALPAHPGTLR